LETPSQSAIGVAYPGCPWRAYLIEARRNGAKLEIVTICVEDAWRRPGKLKPYKDNFDFQSRSMRAKKRQKLWELKMQESNKQWR
jgi:hypothetical protein